jgi:hypothetical protein
MRMALGFGVALALLVVIGFAVATFVVDRRTAQAIEEHAGAALGVPSSLERASVGLLTGRFTLSDLRISNPQGFDAPEVILMGEGEGRIRLTTLLGEVVELSHLTISDTEMHLERRGGTGNYEPILAHYIEEGRHVGDPDRRYVIDELLVRDVVVHLDLMPDRGEEARLRVPIEELRLVGVGEEDAGLMLQEVIGVVVQALFEAALERAAEELPGVLLRELGDRLRELTGREGLPFDP